MGPLDESDTICMWVGCVCRWLVCFPWTGDVLRNVCGCMWIGCVCRWLVCFPWTGDVLRNVCGCMWIGCVCRWLVCFPWTGDVLRSVCGCCWIVALGYFEESLFEFVDCFSLWPTFLIALWIVWLSKSWMVTELRLRATIWYFRSEIDCL